jgi:glycosyltransferase involved in cell wall biosynthesis
MPVFNERGTVAAAIDQVLATELPIAPVELIVVDDGSVDGTAELLSGERWPAGVHFLRHDRNLGKGAAVRTALTAATGDYAAIMDADLEYDPADLERMLEPALAHQAEVVFGTRGFDSHSAFSFWYVVGNKSVTLAANLLFNSWLADIMTCQKLMRTELFRSLDLRSTGFTIEPEITARVLSRGYQIYEVPVTYRARGRSEGKKLTASDGVRVLGTLVRCRVEGGRLPDRVRHHA